MEFVFEWKNTGSKQITVNEDWFSCSEQRRKESRVLRWKMNENGVI